MLPRPSLCLNLPKTGSTYTARFFAAADWLHLQHACGLRRLHVPARLALESMNAFKRLGVRHGSLNPLLPAHHAGYSALPARLRVYPRLCTLRDAQGWYCSQYLYYTRRLKPSLLGQAIRLLVHGRDVPLDPRLRTILLRHRSEFLERFRNEGAHPDPTENVSVPFLFWFNHAVRGPFKLGRWFGVDTWPSDIGYLTFRTIALLFEDPARVFTLPEEGLEDYFASGAYRRDLRADFFLRFDTLTDDLCAVMAGELGYRPDILDYLAEREGRKNVSPRDLKPQVISALNARDLSARIRRGERIYERYLLPLAGTTAGNDPAAGQSPHARRRDRSPADPAATHPPPSVPGP